MNQSSTRRPLRFGKALAFVTTVLAAFAGVSFSQSASVPVSQDGQQAALPKLSYDVVSIRPSDGERASGFTYGDPADKATFDAVNTPLQVLIGSAYGERHYEMSGGPDWITSKSWIIHAKSDDAATEALKKLNNDQAQLVKKQMLRQLLEDRFHLQVRSTMKEAQTYDLVVDKKGPKFQESQGTATSGGGTMCGPSVCKLVGPQTNMKALARVLSNHVSAEVTDKTGLNGIYDVTLSFRVPSAADTSVDEPLIFTALEEQLGLKLVPVKGLKQLIVIDHIEMPAEN